MRPTLLQAQIRAWGIGLLWFFPYALLMQSPLGLLALLGFPLLIAFVTAVVTGPYDLLVFITLLIPGAYDILMQIHMHLAHPVAGTVLEMPALIELIFWSIIAIIGLALKRRWLRDQTTELPDEERPRFYRWLGFDFGLLVLIPTILFCIDVIKVAHQPTPQQVAESQSQLLLSPATTDSQRIQVMLALQQHPLTPESLDALRQNLQTGSPKVKQAAAIFLLAKGDSSSLSFLENDLMRQSQFTVDAGQIEMHTDWLGYGTSGPSFCQTNLGLCLSSIRDPAAIPILTRLLTSSDVNVRRGAGSALRRLGPESTFPGLIDSLLAALNDPDFEVRYFAVGALMTATGDPHYPSTTLFRENEAAFVEPWKEWAKDRSAPPPRSKIYLRMGH